VSVLTSNWSYTLINIGPLALQCCVSFCESVNRTLFYWTKDLYLLFTQKNSGDITVLPWLEPLPKHVICFTFIHVVLVSIWPPQKQCKCFLYVEEMMLVDLYHTGIRALNAEAGDCVLMQLLELLMTSRLKKYVYLSNCHAETF
jgi:hypothetical protein